MGMASSQARLLALTSRMHDVEYKAQNIMSQKVALATQEDDIYQEYCDALDATKIQVAFMGDSGSRQYVDASFATVCKYQEGRIKQYALHDSQSGKLVVDNQAYDTYHGGYDNDKYAFALAMIGLDSQMTAWNNSEQSDHTSTFIGRWTQSEYGVDTFITMTEVEEDVYNEFMESQTGQKSKLSALYEAMNEIIDNPESTIVEKKEALESFRDELYNELGPKIYQSMCYDKQIDKEIAMEDEGIYSYDFNETDFPKSEFEFYVHLFEEIEAAGGCISITDLKGGSENDKEWFNNMVNNGRLIISVYNDKGANKGWQETSVATAVNESMLMEVQDDTNRAKAEAKYKHELSIINKKETKFDQELKNLETEENALKTEIDSIKEVKNNNIERTFGIFS